MTGPTAARLPGDRLHLQHGPIDLIIGVDRNRAQAFDAAWARFQTVLAEVMEELPALRSCAPCDSDSPVPKRMIKAAQPHQATTFVTPMAAVAGSIADDVLQHIISGLDVGRAYVNNGGDIALSLSGEETYSLSLMSPAGEIYGDLMLTTGDDIGGVATSGQGGRSHSLGVADSVTVLAKDAAAADVAATLIANAVDLPGHPNIRRVPACDLRPDSDLGARLVVTSVGALKANEVRAALRRGQRVAQQMRDEGLIIAAALFLRNENCLVGDRRLIKMKEKADA